MKHLKTLGLLTAAAMSVMALAASSASAFTVEVGGVTKNGKVELSGGLASGSSAVMSRTDGSLANTCTSASAKGFTESPFTGSVGGTVEERSYGGCTRTVTVHNDGSGKIEHISSSTNGTITSSGAEVTTGSPFGTLNCKTGLGVHMGVLTGAASGDATVDINAVLNCGFLVPSATFKATLVVSSPSGVGIVA